MLAANTISCSESETETQNHSPETAPNNDPAQETETETETEEKPDLPDKNYDGCAFRIVGNKATVLPYMPASEYVGEVLNDAIYDAKRKQRYMGGF